jgi:hypothetical protein
MTGLTVAERYQRHKAGIQAGKRRVELYGAGLLPDLYERFNAMSDPHARLMEAELTKTIRRLGHNVHSA